MILPLYFTIALALLVLSLRDWKRKQTERKTQSWETLIARLRVDWSARELCDQFLWKEDVTVSPEEAWLRMHGPHGLWVMHQNAKVMLEMANFAASHNTGDRPIDPVLIETLRSDAMQIRLCVLMALAKYASIQTNAGTRINAFRAAKLYSSMAARMTGLLQNHAATIIPDFVAAM